MLKDVKQAYFQEIYLKAKVERTESSNSCFSHRSLKETYNYESTYSL